MVQTVQHIIEERRASGAMGTVNDLLDRMLTGVDRQSGEKLDDTNIIAQCITFLIAGHETTSGLLSFALYALLKNPEVLARAYDEVDRVLGTDLSVLPTYAQIASGAVRRPDPRGDAAAVAHSAGVHAPAVRGHRPRRQVPAGEGHRRRWSSPRCCIATSTVWGENPEAFDPDRFSPENRAKIPPNAYKPFGTGQRACIGRQFALQEAALVLSMLLQRFEFIDFADYQLETKQTLTIKPTNFHIKVRMRAGRTATAPLAAPRPAAEPRRPPGLIPPPRPAGRRAGARRGRAPQRRCWCCIGSNLGTAEGLAHAIAEDAKNRGFVATVGPLDDHVGALPKEGGRGRRQRLLQRPAARQRREVLQVASGPLIAAGCVRRRRVQRLRLRQSRLGGDLPGDPHADRRRAREAWRQADVRARRGRRARRFRQRLPRLVRRAVAGRGRGAEPARAAWRRSRQRGPRFSVTLHQQAGGQPDRPLIQLPPA